MAVRESSSYWKTFMFIPRHIWNEVGSTRKVVWLLRLMSHSAADET